MPTRKRRGSRKAPAKSPKVTFKEPVEEPTPKKMRRLSEPDLEAAMLQAASGCRTQAQLSKALDDQPRLRAQIRDDMVTPVMSKVHDDPEAAAVAKLRMKEVVLVNLAYAQKIKKTSSKKFAVGSPDADHLAAVYAAMTLAIACKSKGKSVDVSPLVSGPGDAECYDKTSMLRLSEQGNIDDCHAARCAYNTGGSWFASIAGNSCMSCETFLKQANADGRVDALVQFFWFTSLAASANTPSHVCVHGDQMLDLAMVLLESRGQGKAVGVALKFGPKEYFDTMKSPVFQKSLTEKAGELVTFKNAAVLAGMAALLYGGHAVYASGATGADILAGARTYTDPAKAAVKAAAGDARTAAIDWGSWAATEAQSFAQDTLSTVQAQLKFMMTGKIVSTMADGASQASQPKPRSNMEIARQRDREEQKRLHKEEQARIAAETKAQRERDEAKRIEKLAQDHRKKSQNIIHPRVTRPPNIFPGTENNSTTS